ncbi:MAG TPA: helix-turn-helix domain-containing protein [Solirubrobacteraceae bacterium]|nr:helix-turn-helix domain-containing protein [Solirubrobacteraceae bacterium]
MDAELSAVDTPCLDGLVEQTPETEQPRSQASLQMAGVAPERRDALRNRARVLAAAQRLVSESGVEAVEIREVARAAGVGVGTVYRRFGDKAGLVASLLDERERLFQDRLLGGPPPLGPGAPARERLVAFLHGLVDMVDENLQLLRALHGATPGARFRVGAYRAWRLHATILLEEAAPGIDAAWFAEMLLAPLAADLYYHQRDELGVSRERLKQNLADAVDAVVGAAAARA